MRHLIAALAVALSPAAVAASAVQPDFTSAIFTANAPVNPYFPLTTGLNSRLVAHGDENGVAFTETVDLTNLGSGPVILGVQTTTQRDLTYEDGVLVEETLDYYATDSTGNVWYFGEDVINYNYDANGVLIGTDNDSAWLAGVNGALPGWIMPADPVVGLSYFQEIAAADDALDQAMIHAVGQTVSINGVGTFTDVLVTLETSQLDPDAREFKYYAPGIGLIRIEEGLDPNLSNPDLVFDLVQPVPIPSSLPLLLGALTLGAAVARRRQGGKDRGAV